MDKFNKLAEDYKKSYFSEFTQVLKDSSGNKINLDEIMKNKKHLLKPIKAKFSKIKEGTFNLTNIKDLITKK